MKFIFIKQKLLWQGACIGVIFFMGGFLVKWAIDYHNNAAIDALAKNLGPIRESDTHYKYIQPLLLCGLVNKQIKKFEPLEQKIDAYVGARKSEGSLYDLGFYFQDLNTGKWAGVNENEKFSPASLLKVPTMVMFFKYAEEHPEILSKGVLYQGDFDDTQAQTIKPPHMLEAGHTYTINDLIKRMVVDSDNNAARLLHQSIDSQTLTDVYTDLSVPVPSKDASVDFMSPKLYSYFFRVLYNATYLTRESSEKALGLLTIPDYRGGIRAGLPANVVTAQKFGERSIYSSETGQIMYHELHDCGIVYYPGDPYLVCVMTKGKDMDILSKTITDISKLVYEAVKGGLQEN